MAYIKAFFLFAVVAVALAAEEAVRTKKDVLLASPYAAVSYAYDDGSYYPGKYEKTAYVAAVPAGVPAVHAAVPAVHAASVAVPAVTAYSSYAYHPYAYSYRPVIV